MDTDEWPANLGVDGECRESRDKVIGNVNCFSCGFTPMLIKQKDDVQPALDILEGFLALKTLTKQQREQIEDQFQTVRTGAKGEKDAAYHIDFKLKDSKNWAVVHDLRLEHNGRVAQVDHLLINRRFDVFFIESKNLKTAVRVNKDDEFEVKTRYGWKGMASPVEQNKRHTQVLSELIGDEKLMPTRLGVSIRPKFHNWVLIAPECNLVKGEQKEATVLKMDMFDKGLEQFINHSPLIEALTMTKLCSAETELTFAEKLVGFHKPIAFDYTAKFGISDAQRFSGSTPVHLDSTEKTSSSEKHTCERCHEAVESKVAAFCRSHEKRFGGKILCRTCQTVFYEPKPVAEAVNVISGPTCDECKTSVDSKIVAFCRFNSKRLNKRVLCRTCHIMSVVAVG